MKNRMWTVSRREFVLARFFSIAEGNLPTPAFFPLPKAIRPRLAFFPLPEATRPRLVGLFDGTYNVDGFPAGMENETWTVSRRNSFTLAFPGTNARYYFTPNLYTVVVR
jgi:hypothetical protein